MRNSTIDINKFVFAVVIMIYHSQYALVNWNINPFFKGGTYLLSIISWFQDIT